MDEKFSWKITWVSFVGNVLIFLHHANLKDYYPEKTTAMSVAMMDFFSYLAVIAMSWFFFISGYLFFRNFEMSKFKDKLLSRCRTLLIPYIIWNTFSVLLQMLKGGNVLKDGALSFIKDNYVFAFGGGCANGPLWYIFRLIEFVILAPMIYYIIRNNKIGFVAIAVVFILNLLNGTGYFEFWYFVPIYMLGSWIGLNFYSDLERTCIAIDGHKLVFTLALLVAIVELLMNLVIGSVSYWVRIVCLIPLLYIIRRHSFGPPKAYTKIGMFLYCVHDIIFRIVRNIITLFDMNMVLSWLVLIASSTVVIVVAWIILRRYMPRTLNLLTGGRD